MKICYINNLVYILVLFLLALILYNAFMNKINYDKNIEKFYNEGDIVTKVAIDRDGTVMSKTSETEILEETREAVADVSENTQRMEQILDRLEKISTEFNQSIEYNEEIVNEYNKILKDINYISDVNPDKIYQFLAGFDNNDIISGVEILKNILKSQIDKESESVQSESKPVEESVEEEVEDEVEEEVEPQSIEKYSYAFIGNGYCDQTASGAHITLLNNNDCFMGSSTDSVQKCLQQCNNTNKCDYISFTSSPEMHHCCLYDDPENHCNFGANETGNGFKPKSKLGPYWNQFQTYKKIDNCSNHITAFKTVRNNNAGDTISTNDTCQIKLNILGSTGIDDEEIIKAVMYKDPKTPGCLPIGCESLNQRREPKSLNQRRETIESCWNKVKDNSRIKQGGHKSGTCNSTKRFYDRPEEKKNLFNSKFRGNSMVATMLDTASNCEPTSRRCKNVINSFLNQRN